MSFAKLPKNHIVIDMNPKQVAAVKVAAALAYKVLDGKGHCPEGFAINALDAMAEAGLIAKRNACPRPGQGVE